VRHSIILVGAEIRSSSAQIDLRDSCSASKFYWGLLLHYLVKLVTHVCVDYGIGTRCQNTEMISLVDVRPRMLHGQSKFCWLICVFLTNITAFCAIIYWKCLSGFPHLLEISVFFLAWKFQDLECPGKICLKITHFHRLKKKTSSSSISPRFVLTVPYLNTAYNSSNFFSACFICLNAYFFVIFKHSWAMNKFWKICPGVLESYGKVLDIFVITPPFTETSPHSTGSFRENLGCGP